MLLQQTSKYLMRVIPKKEPTLILDLAFLHAPSTRNPDLAAAAHDLRSPATLQALIHALFAQRYDNAKATLAQLLATQPDSDRAWLHFHPRAGNALSLAYGIPPPTQRITTFSPSPAKRSPLRSQPASVSSSPTR